MSKRTKVSLIVALICIAAGVFMFFGGMLILDFDFKKINTMAFENNTYYVENDFDNIEIKDIECDIRLVPASDGVCKVECRESEKIINTVSVEERTLKINRKDTRKWYERIGIWFDEKLTVTVYLPKDEYKNIYLKSVSGDIEVPNSFSFEKAEVRSTSGDISFAAKTSLELSVKTTSGDLCIENVASGKLGVTTVSGDIQLSEITADTLEAATTSGDIELKAVVTDGKTDLKSVSGDIELYRSDALSFLIKTTSGDVEGEILTSKNFITDTTSGYISVPKSDDAAGEFNVTTTSGDIKVRIAE